MNARVDVWRITTGAGLAAPRDLLAPVEIVRADRFRAPVDRIRFVQQRIALRRILGAYLGKAPALLEFAADDRRKPVLPGLHFNLSHSEDLALLAVSRETPLGVDVEALARLRDHASLVTSVLTPAEQAQYHAFAPEARAAAFLRFWTVKEAYLKGTGEGLAFPLTDICVTFEPEATVRITVRGRPHERWTIRSLAPAPDHIGALAVAADDAVLRWMDFLPDAPISVP